MELDELDIRILQALQEDARLSYRSLAKRLDSSAPTIGARVRRLESLGVITGYRTEIDLGHLPGTLYLVTGALAGDDLPSHPEAEYTVLLPGRRVQFIIHSQRANPARIDQWCREHAVADVAITPVLESLRGRTTPIGLERIHLQCHHCRAPILGEAVTGQLDGRTHAFCCPLCRGAFEERHRELSSKA